MDCWAHINGKDYPIAYGWTLTDEFSETLDSASITLPHVVSSIDLKPYDDVIIHDFGEGNLPPREFGVSYQELFASQGHFYRHMLCYSFTKERVFIDKITENGSKFRCYNYNIELVSETKGLETVQLPNKTISQPIGTKESGVAIGNDVASVSFDIAGETYSLPYSCVNDWRDGLLVKEVHHEPLSPMWRRWFLFAGDVDATTSDLMSFTSIKKIVKTNSLIRLPDFNITGITLAFGTTFLWAWDLLDYQTYKPTKHWIIRKLGGTQQGNWSSRANIVQTISNYLSGTDYSEIKNASLTNGQRDINSANAISAIDVGFTATGDYEIYMYIEPQNVTLYSDEYEDWGEGPEPVSYGTFNIFGMTNNANGNTSPISGETDVSVPFLAKWTFAVSDALQQTKGVLTVYEAIRQLLELYTPYVKLRVDREELDGVWYDVWDYRRKYSMDDSLIGIFGNVSAPENQFNYPNLRDCITRLMYVKNCIPIVRDNVISCMNLSQRSTVPFHIPEENMSYEQYSMDGSSYTDRLLRIYSDGLSKDNIVNCVERVGFKNKDSSTLTLENMRLELDHPIYKIKKVYMCYYNTYETVGELSNEKKMKLCKQDITPLVLLNSQRQLLHKDYINNAGFFPKTIEDLATYYFATVGYDVGSRYITGWGTNYSVPQWVFWKTERTVVENILKFMMTNYPFGVSERNEIVMPSNDNQEMQSNASDDRYAVDENGNDFLIASADVIGSNSTYATRIGQLTQRLKSLTFIIEYEGFLSASVLSTKEKHDGNVVTRDNASSSLSFVESDGINQRDKANRLGNATRTVSARHKDFADIQFLSSVWNSDSNVGQTDQAEIEDVDEEHDDEICFKRVISFQKDYFTCSYFLCRNYILRNYFTSVFAKHRPFPLASYEESVERQENKSLEVLFSPDSWYFQDGSRRVAFDIPRSADRLLSFFKESEFDTVGNIMQNNGVDIAFYGVYPSKEHLYKGQVGFFATDLMKFVSGNSLCFTIPMKDNVSAGVYVADYDHNLGQFIGETWKKTWEYTSTGTVSWDVANSADDASVLLTGARQNWHMFPVDPKSGMMYAMRFAVGYKENDIYAVDNAVEYSAYDIAEAQLLPLLDAEVRLVGGMRQYFGKRNDSNDLVGAGYPRLRFRLPDAGSLSQGYRVTFESADRLFEYDELLEEADEFYGFEFANYDGQIVGYREKIDCFAEAIFYGYETTESLSENPLCIFKDGKERICTTIQFEPVSEDVRIRFSPYMMKLSDAVGGKPKTYSDQTIVSNMLCTMSVANIRALYTYYEEGALRNYLSAIFSTPTLSIGLPEHSFLDYNTTIPFSKTYTFSHMNAGGPTYSLEITGIEPVQYVNGQYILLANVVIIMNGTTITSGQIQLVDISANKNGNITGLAGTSVFGIADTCVFFGAGYKTFAMVEDRGFVDSNGNYPYRFDNYGSSSVLHYPNLPAPSFPSDSFVYAITSSSYLDWSDARLSSSGHNYTKTTITEREDNFPPNHEFTASMTLNAPYLQLMDVGPEIGEPISKPKNMTWIFTPELITLETENSMLSDFAEIGGEELSLLPNRDVYVYCPASGPTKGMAYLDIVLPSALSGTGSIRLYYLDDDGFQHFVFGINVGQPNPEYEQPNCVYPLQDGVTYRTYISFLDDRSRTVIDNIEGSYTRGDPVYRVADFAQDDIPQNASDPFNIAVEK